MPPNPRPDATIGSIQAVVWLDNEMVCVVTSNGYLRLLQYSPQEGMLLEDQHKPTSGGVSAACLCAKTGHVAIVTPGAVTFFDPLMLETTATMTVDPQNGKIENQPKRLCSIY